MKTRFLFTAMLFAALSLGFASCDNDKGNEPDDPQGEQTEQSGSTENNGGGEETPTPEEPVTFTLVLLSSDEAMGTVTEGGVYDKNAEVTITATAKENCYLTGWSDCDSKELSRTITLTSDSTITAKFAKKPYLTVKTNSSDYGTVTGSGYYIPGEEVTITATPKPGFKFVKWNDGNTENPRTVIVNENMTYTANFELFVSGTENGFGYVDLGLPSGLKWATCNVGATKPEEYGDYFAWGETTPKTTYSWGPYKWCNGSDDTMTKYCTDSYCGYVDDKTVLDPEDDAAAVNMGGSWRMPTIEELQELIDECTWTWTTLNDVNGYNVEGPNGNAIFLPAAGSRIDSDLLYAGSFGGCWSSSLTTESSRYAYGLYSDSGYVNRLPYYRYNGHSVRGVCE